LTGAGDRGRNGYECEAFEGVITALIAAERLCCWCKEAARVGEVACPLHRLLPGIGCMRAVNPPACYASPEIRPMAASACDQWRMLHIDLLPMSAALPGQLFAVDRVGAVMCGFYVCTLWHSQHRPLG
jgi:hypothetical protein